MTSFRIRGLSPALFRDLYGLSDEQLSARGARRYRVDATPGYPDRIEMRDLEVGENAILLNFTHMDLASPYRSSHAIFVREGAERAYDAIDEVPEVLRRRLLSVRAFDGAGMMQDAEVLQGHGLREWLSRTLQRRDVAFIDVHNAKRGCFAARATRAVEAHGD